MAAAQSIATSFEQVILEPPKHSPNSECFLISDYSDRFVTPRDELTGLPYCFAPNSSLPPPLAHNAPNNDRPADWNHMMPKYEVRTRSNESIGVIGRMALEGSRVQWVDYDEHHYKYNFWFDGPEQPQTKQELFEYLVMAEAGYVPEGAIDLNDDSPKITLLSPAQRKELWQSGQVRVYDPSIVRKYLFDYVLEQDLDHFSSKDIKKLVEFLHTFDYERRLYLGYCLAARIIERAIDPLCETYSQALGEHVLPGNMPNNPRDLVKRRLMTQGRVGWFMNELSRKAGEHNRQVIQPTKITAAAA